MTRLLAVDNDADLRLAAQLLREGKRVAFPTETVYGLGANALRPDAVAGIFAAKQRPSWDPLIVHVASAAQVESVAQLTGQAGQRARALMEAFWPGPLTLLLPRLPVVPDSVTAGRGLVGVRAPDHPVAQALLRAAGMPVAAPSANRFGHTSPTTAAHVLADLEGRIEAVLDGGPCRVGVESTVLDPETMTIYRAGAVTVEAVAEVCGMTAKLFQAPARPPENPSALPSPGVGLRHYAPSVPLVLTEGTQEALAAAVERSLEAGTRTAVLLPGDWALQPGLDIIVARWGQWSDEATLAAGLFAALRTLETSGAETILCPMPARGGLRDALRDRLFKAARPK